MRARLYLPLTTMMLLATSCKTKVDPWEQLLTRHMSVAAVVEKTFCSNHGAVLYGFVVDGRKYTGVTYWLQKLCRQVVVGGAVVVNYDPINPTVNTTLDPSAAYEMHRSEIRDWIGFGVFAVLVMLSSLIRNRW